MTKHFLFGRARANAALENQDDPDAEKDDMPDDEAEKDPKDDAPEAETDEPDEDAEGDDTDEVAKAAASARRAERQECLAILNHCTLFGKPELAAGFIKKGLSAAKVQETLLDQRDKAIKGQGSAHVSSRQTARPQGSGAGRLVAGMKKKFNIKE